MLASTDENFVASKFVTTVSLWLGLGAQQAQIGTAVGFRQTHGARPLAIGEVRQVHLFLFFCSVSMKALVGAVGQSWVHGPRLVGAVEHFIKTLVHHNRQTLTTIGGIATERGPAALRKLCKCVLETFGCCDFVGFVIQLATLLVTHLVQGHQHLSGKFTAFFQDGGNRVGVEFCMGRQALQHRGHIQDFIHHKLHIAQGRGVAGHGQTFFRLEGAP